MTTQPKYEDVVARLDAALSRETALREELSKLADDYCEKVDDILDLQQRLTVAEKILREVLESGDWFRSALEFINGEGLEVREKIEASLKPAAEPEHICEGCGSKGWTANCNQCVPY